MLRFGLSITTDVAKFLCVTLKRVAIPADASSQRLALMKKLDELQQSYPQLHWELEDDDSCGRDSTEPASSMKLLLTILPAAQRWRSEGGMFSLVSCTFVLFVSVCLFVIIILWQQTFRAPCNTLVWLVIGWPCRCIVAQRLDVSLPWDNQ